MTSMQPRSIYKGCGCRAGHNLSKSSLETKSREKQKPGEPKAGRNPKPGGSATDAPRAPMHKSDVRASDRDHELTQSFMDELML